MKENSNFMANSSSINLSGCQSVVITKNNSVFFLCCYCFSAFMGPNFAMQVWLYNIVETSCLLMRFSSM